MVIQCKFLTECLSPLSEAQHAVAYTSTHLYLRKWNRDLVSLDPLLQYLQVRLDEQEQFKYNSSCIATDLKAGSIQHKFVLFLQKQAASPRESP